MASPNHLEWNHSPDAQFCLQDVRRRIPMPVLYLIINLSSAAPVLISVPSGELADCQKLEQHVMVSPEIESTNCVFAQKD
jgi:hypothetical protein